MKVFHRVKNWFYSPSTAKNFTVYKSHKQWKMLVAVNDKWALELSIPSSIPLRRKDLLSPAGETTKTAQETAQDDATTNLQVVESLHLKPSSHSEQTLCPGNLPNPLTQVKTWKWVAVPIGYLLPKERREEWLGDLYEANAQLLRQEYPRWMIECINVGRVLILAWSAIKIEIMDFISKGNRKQE